MKISGTFFFALSVGLSLALCCADPLDELERMLLKGEPSVQRLTEQIGPPALERLGPLAQHEDEKIRIMALTCLRSIAGPAPVEVFVESLTDESMAASVEALRGLEERLEHLESPPLIAVYPKLQDPDRREQVALILARLPDATIPVIQALLEKEEASQAQEALQVALAMRGSESSREFVLQALASSWNQSMKRWLRIVEMIDQDWALRALNPILDDEIPLVYIGVGGLDDRGPQYLRACDLAVNMIARAYPSDFPFPIDEYTQYSVQKRGLAKEHFRQATETRKP